MYTGVPYVPTPPNVVEAMITAARIKPKETVVDLGAGDARLLIAAKTAVPSIKARGCELAPTIWLLAKLRIWLAVKDVSLRIGDAFYQDIRDADVVFLYMMPEVLRKLEPKFTKELKKGARVVSHAFKFKNREPVRTVKVPGRFRDRTVLVYQW